MYVWCACFVRLRDGIATNKFNIHQSRSTFFTFCVQSDYYHSEPQTHRNIGYIIQQHTLMHIQNTAYYKMGMRIVFTWLWKNLGLFILVIYFISITKFVYMLFLHFFRCYYSFLIQFPCVCSQFRMQVGIISFYLITAVSFCWQFASELKSYTYNIDEQYYHIELELRIIIFFYLFFFYYSMPESTPSYPDQIGSGLIRPFCRKKISVFLLGCHQRISQCHGINMGWEWTDINVIWYDSGNMESNGIIDCFAISSFGIRDIFSSFHLFLICIGENGFDYWLLAPVEVPTSNKSDAK